MSYAATDSSELALHVRSRWHTALKIIAAVLAFLSVGAGITAWIYLAHYQPLSNDFLFSVRNAETIPIEVDGIDAGWLVDDMTIVRYEPGGWFAVGGALHNSGRFPVTVTKILRGIQGGAIGLREVRFGPSMNDTDGFRIPFDRAEPFEPFTLEPGEDRVFTAIYAFKDSACRRGTGGGYFGFSSYDIEFEVYGVGREATLPYLNEVGVLLPTRAECKGRSGVPRRKSRSYSTTRS